METSGEPQPPVAEAVPVGIRSEYFEMTRNRVMTLLGELPMPLGPDEIPNGHVRTQLTDAASDATTALDQARAAPTELVTLAKLRQARAEARYAAAGWHVAEEGLTADTLRSEHGQVVSVGQAERSRLAYVGSDPTRTVVVYNQIEALFDWATSQQLPAHEGSQLLSVAEWGHTLETARAALDDARHLTDQFTTSLPEDAGRLQNAIESTAETLLDQVRSTQSELPPEPTADQWDFADHIIGDLKRDIESGITNIGPAAGPASAVIDAYRRLTGMTALSALHDRAESGDLTRPQTADAVREQRAQAIGSLRTAVRDSATPALTRTAVTQAAWRVATADWELARYSGEIDAARLDDTVAAYLVATAIGEAAPTVSKQVAATLRGRS